MMNEKAISDDDPEINAMSVQSMEESCPTSRLLSYFSKWTDLKRAVAWFLKIKDTLDQQQCDENKITNSNLSVKPKVNKKGTTHQLSVDNLEKAEQAIVNYVQNLLLTAGNIIKRSSHLYKLDPVMVNGTLRVGGRLSKVALPEEAKHPATLPKSSNISELVLRRVHEKVGHSGRNHMLSTLRQQFWIHHANALAEGS